MDNILRASSVTLFPHIASLTAPTAESRYGPSYKSRTGFFLRIFITETNTTQLYAYTLVLIMATSEAGVPIPFKIEVDTSVSHSNGAIPSTSNIADSSGISENGRIYQGYNPSSTYALPNDGEEQSRLDLQHILCRRMIGNRLYVAPIQNPKSVMDIATGTGIWALEFANEHPDAKVVGTDLSAIQPPNAAPNASFLQEDAERDNWSHHPQFDFIHARLVAIWFKNLEAVLRKIYNQLTPGGWVEFQELPPVACSQDGTTVGTQYERFLQLVGKGLATIGIENDVTPKLKPLMEKVGFVDIQEVKSGYPVGSWPKDPQMKEIGHMGEANVLSVVRGALSKSLAAAGLSEADIAKLGDNVEAEIRGGMHAYVMTLFICGRKPE
ncbi:hypothetical protein VHEMI02338 [[Torrubiella] hemipterigena]|uniref:Methyltransferase domain-containing protein n=1 Tax=[Torrubiella] hemipterigena TaxID=1531966 RepID=A0A0A1T7K8_9HYPO|nr:hypothetical protein VHEMI02338 [[Torrubiella] hemipterigena]